MTDQTTADVRTYTVTYGVHSHTSWAACTCQPTRYLARVTVPSPTNTGDMEHNTRHAVAALVDADADLVDVYGWRYTGDVTAYVCHWVPTDGYGRPLWDMPTATHVVHDGDLWPSGPGWSAVADARDAVACAACDAPGYDDDGAHVFLVTAPDGTVLADAATVDNWF